MGAECFTKGLPLQAKQRQPSPALAFLPNGYYGVKFCVFCMISIYLDLSILFILRKTFLLRIVVSEKILWDLTALLCFHYYFFLSHRSDGFPPPVTRHELPHSPTNQVYQEASPRLIISQWFLIHRLVFIIAIARKQLYKLCLQNLSRVTGRNLTVRFIFPCLL